MPAIAAPAATWTGGPTSRESFQPDSTVTGWRRRAARRLLGAIAGGVLVATIVPAAGCASDGGGIAPSDRAGAASTDAPEGARAADASTTPNPDAAALGLDGPTRPRDASAADLAGQLGAGFDALGGTGPVDASGATASAPTTPRAIARGDLLVEPLPEAESTATTDPATDPTPAPALADAADPATERATDPAADVAPRDDPMRAAMRDGLAGSLADLRRLAVARAGQDAHPLRWLLMVATTALVEPELPFDPTGFADLTEAEQQVLARAHEHFAELGRQLADGDGSESVLPELERLVTALRGEPSFRLDRLTLCSSVRNFGDFTALEPPMFFTGRESAFVWYGELQGFTSVRDEERDAWRTELETRMTIYDRASGIPVRTGSPELVRDLASAKRSDFFLNQLVRLPGNLPVGVYTLKIAVKDLSSGAFAEATADFAMVIDEAIDPDEIARIVRQYGD